MPLVRTPSRIEGLYSPGWQARLNSVTVRTSPAASISSALGELLDRVGLALGHLPDAVLVANHIDRLRVEDLHRHALRLLHHLAAVLGVGVVAVVGALVDEALAVEVDDDADRVGMLLEVVEHHAVAERRRADVPLHRVTGGPAAERLRADVQRRLDAVAGVVPRAAHAAELPARAEVAHAHLRVGLEAAAGQHHRLRGDVLVAVGTLDANAGDVALAVLEQLAQSRLVADLDARFSARLNRKSTRPQPPPTASMLTPP